MMRALLEAASRLVSIFRRSRLDSDFDEELAWHIDQLTEANIRRGLAPDEARRQAILRMGGLNATRELQRDARGLPRVERVIHASVQAWRSLRNAKAVGLLAAGALAIGIGSATAIYTVVNAVMLKPLPYRDGHRFVAVFAAATTDPERYSHLSLADVRIYQERNRSFDAFGWYRGAGKNLTFAGEPHHVNGVAVTTSLAHHLGVDPLLGRWFDDETGAVISHGLWQRFGGVPDVVGKPLALDGRMYTVTGVMPPAFRLPVAGVISDESRVDVWMGLDPPGRGEPSSGYTAYGRRKPDVSYAAAVADMKRIAAEIAAEDPRTHAGYTARVFDLRETAIKDIRPLLLMLFAAAGLLFAIACANAAGLLLTRAVARSRETAMRVALGASRGQLATHYIAEGLLIALIGAAGGVLLSLTLTPAIVSMGADYLPRADEIAVDWTVLLFALLAACVATAVSSLAPLGQASRTTPRDVLSEGSRSSAGVRSRRLSQSLVVAEIALSFALLTVGAVLMIHLAKLSRTSPGFDPDRVLAFVVSVPNQLVRERATRMPLQQRLLEAIESIPGVEHAAFANQVPLKDCCRGTTFQADGRPVEPGTPRRSALMAITPGYFRVMRVPLRAGRLLTEDDWKPQNASLIPAVINESAARRYWGTTDPIGSYGRFDAGARFQVVGVVGDVKNDGLGIPVVPEVYIPAYMMAIEGMWFVVRSPRLPSSLIPDIRRAVRGVDPELPVYQSAPMREIVRDALTLERVASFITAFFAGAALLMATLGVYGVLAYSVRQRTVEIGTRMALGATSGGVLSLIIGGGLKMAALGVAAGGLAAVAAVSYLDRVFPVGEIGVMPFVYAAAIVAVVAFAASSLPAWRAALLSPISAIRNEPDSLWHAARLRLSRAQTQR